MYMVKQEDDRHSGMRHRSQRRSWNEGMAELTTERTVGKATSNSVVVDSLGIANDDGKVNPLRVKVKRA
jgi:hypothetical protein